MLVALLPPLFPAAAAVLPLPFLPHSLNAAAAAGAAAVAAEEEVALALVAAAAAPPAVAVAAHAAALLPPLFPAAIGAVLPLPFLPHFLTAAAGMLASPPLDVASDALSVAETVPLLAQRTLCCPAWSARSTAAKASITAARFTLDSLSSINPLATVPRCCRAILRWAPSDISERSGATP